MAVVGGVEVAVRLHIDRGDDLDSRDNRGSTPLMLAAARNKARICRLLIDAGADMLALDPSGRDALAIAKAAGALDSASTIEAALARKVAQASQVERSTQLGAPKNKGEGADCEDGRAGSVRDDAWADSEAHSTTADSPAKPTENRSAEPTNPAHPLASDNPSSAALSAAVAATLASAVEPLSIDEEGSLALDPSGWETDESRPPPIDDASLATAQAAIQKIITRHAPIDDSSEWADFEVFLPEHAAPLPRPEDAESTAELRRLLLRALREGSVPEFDAEDLCVGADGAADPASLSLLRFVINDLGAETDERFEYRLPRESFEVFVDSAETQDEEEAVGDAMAFLVNLDSHHNDPLRLYMREAQRRSLITAEEEAALAKAMEDAVKRALDALASWRSGIECALAAVDRARSGQRALNSITAGSRDEVEPDHIELVEGTDLDSPISVSVFSVESDEESDADEASDDAAATQEAVTATESLAIGFFEKAAEFSALYGSCATLETKATAARAALSSLSLKRTFLMELADAAVDDKSEPACRFLAAVRSLAVSRDRMAGANLRLVLSIAKRYLFSGLPMDDLIQEGNIGLLKAVDKFDWRRGYKFSTMATWWIRQQVSRSVADDARTIRLPVHVHEKLQRVEREAEALARSSGRDPSSAEVAARLSMPTAKVEALLRASAPPLPLHSTDDDGDLVFECIEDHRPDPFETLAAKELRSTLEVLLSKLGEKPERVLRMRFGLGVDDPLTLEEVGLQFDVTRERIRQIESKALKRLDQRLHREMLLGWLREEEPEEQPSADEAEEPGANDEDQAQQTTSSAPAVEPTRKLAARPSDERGQSQQPSAIDRLIAQAVDLGISVDDHRSGGNRSTWVNMTEARDAPTRALVRKLIAMGFEYWPGKGYWR